MPFLFAIWNYLLSFSLYLVIGLLIAGFIHAFIPFEKIQKSFSGNSFISVLKAALFGVPLPLCSCSVLPTAVTLKKNKASNGATSAFLISTPETGVDSIFLTYGVMDFPMTIFRPIAALLSALLAGVLQNGFNKFEYHDEESEKISSCCSPQKSCSSKVERKSFGSKIAKMMKFAFGDLMDDMALWLTFGVIIGVAIEMLVPLNLINDIPAIQQKAIILLVGLPLYICASAVTPIAASLIMKGLSPGAGLLLLLVGPATNISNILVMQKYIGKWGVVINVISVALVALGMSSFVDWFYTGTTLSFNIMGDGHHAETANWLEVSSAVIVALLLLKGIVYNESVRKFFKSGKSCCEG